MRTRWDESRVAVAGVGGFAAGVALAYLLDPENGRRRRHVGGDRVAGAIRRAAERSRRTASQKARYTAGVAEGVVQEATTGPRDPARLNDPALEAKVESVIFRPREAPKGDVNVNVEDGVVYLRGQLDSEAEIARLVGAAREVDGVRDVRSLLHLPGEPAPTTDPTRAKV